MLLSELLQKDVVTDNKMVGKVDGVCWQKGQRYLLSSGDKIFSADKLRIKQNVFATNLQVTNDTLPPLELGKKVYDTNGKLLGEIADAQLSATLRLKHLVLDNGNNIALSKIVANNDIVTIRVSKPKATQTKTTNATDDTINDLTRLQGNASSQCDDTTQLVTAPTRIADKCPLNERPTATTVAPKRKSGDFSFLVGKVVDKNIFNFLGELMIKEGEVVTRQVYLQARSFGKLTELCLHAK